MFIRLFSIGKNALYREQTVVLDKNINMSIKIVTVFLILVGIVLPTIRIKSIGLFFLIPFTVGFKRIPR